MDLCQHASLRCAVRRRLFDLRWRVTVYSPPTGLFDWRLTAFPGMKLDTKRVAVDESLKFYINHGPLANGCSTHLDVNSAAQDHAVQHDHAATLWHRLGEEVRSFLPACVGQDGGTDQL